MLSESSPLLVSSRALIIHAYGRVRCRLARLHEPRGGLTVTQQNRRVLLSVKKEAAGPHGGPFNNVRRIAQAVAPIVRIQLQNPVAVVTSRICYSVYRLRDH